MLSGCMIVQDEEECLARALDSIHDYVDEIVVVDGGSTDGTKAIAESYPKVRLHDIGFRPTDGDRFDVQRNRAIELTQGEWILVIDADEYYDPHVMNALPSLMNPESIGLPPHTDAYGFSRRTFIDGHLMNITHTDPQIRLFKRWCRYNGHIHEGVTGYAFAVFCNLHIMHDKTTAWQQKDNERCWDMGQEPTLGWTKVDGVWQYTPPEQL
jgi:glycosyltransferase involved in cell wall biosynthesis